MNLVTGATGHIGNVLVRQLLAAGEQVRVLVLVDENLAPLEGLKIEVVPGDIRDGKHLETAMQGVDIVYHLAGIVSILPGREDFLQQVNVGGTCKVIEAARRAKVRRLVYTSSIHAITRAPHGTTIDESLPFDPANSAGPYDRTKAQASMEVLKAVQEGLDAVIVCPTGVIGPFDFRRSIIGRILEDCLMNRPQFYVDGAYDFVDVRDVAAGHLLAARHGRSGETYILSGELLPIRRMIDQVWQMTGARFQRFRIPFSLARLVASLTPLYYSLIGGQPRFTAYSLETLHSNSDISHAKATVELGYTPRPLLHTLADSLEWLRINRLHPALARG